MKNIIINLLKMVGDYKTYRFLKIIILFLMFLPVIFSFEKVKIKPGVEIKLFNKDTINDGDYINFIIKNNTNNKYCFLLDTIALKLKTPYTMSNRLMLNQIFHIFNDKHEFQTISLNDVYCDYNKEVYEHNEKLNFKKTIKNLIKINPKSYCTFKVKFNANVKYSDYCWRNYNNEKSKKYYFGLILYYNDFFLNEKMLDSIENMGYKMYKKTLKSNKVPFKFKD